MKDKVSTLRSLAQCHGILEDDYERSSWNESLLANFSARVYPVIFDSSKPPAGQRRVNAVDCYMTKDKTQPTLLYIVGFTETERLENMWICLENKDDPDDDSKGEFV